MDISSFKIDSKAAEAGDWVDGIPNFGDVRFKVRSRMSPTVIALQSRKERSLTANERADDGLTPTPDAAMRIWGEVLFEAVLLDWDNIKDGTTPIVYSKELAKQFCTDPDMILFQDAITWAATVLSRKIDRKGKEQEKNSQRSSDGESGSPMAEPTSAANQPSSPA